LGEDHHSLQLRRGERGPADFAVDRPPGFTPDYLQQPVNRLSFFKKIVFNGHAVLQSKAYLNKIQIHRARYIVCDI
jgi:hypothetical protein